MAILVPSIFDCMTYANDVLFFKYVYIFIIVYTCGKYSEIIIIEVELLMYFTITFSCLNNKVKAIVICRHIIYYLCILYIMYEILLNF